MCFLYMGQWQLGNLGNYEGNEILCKCGNKYITMELGSQSS